MITNAEMELIDNLYKSREASEFSDVFIELGKCCTKLVRKDIALLHLGGALNNLFVVYDNTNLRRADNAVAVIDDCIKECFSKSQGKNTNEEIIKKCDEALLAFEELERARRSRRGHIHPQHEIDGEYLKRMDYLSGTPEGIARACDRNYVEAIIWESECLIKEGNIGEASDLLSRKIGEMQNLAAMIGNCSNSIKMILMGLRVCSRRREADNILDCVTTNYDNALNALQNKLNSIQANTVVNINANVIGIAKQLSEAVKKIDEKFSDTVNAIRSERSDLLDFIASSIRENEDARVTLNQFFSSINEKLDRISGREDAFESNIKELRESVNNVASELPSDIAGKVSEMFADLLDELGSLSTQSGADRAEKLSRQVQSCHDRIMTFLKTNLGEKIDGVSISDRLDSIEKRTNDYLQEYSSAINENVSCDPNNAMSERYNTIERYYSSNFEDKWISLDKETKKNLVSAVCLWQLINENSQIKALISYRCITNPLAVALECEVKKRFFESFKSWYHENYKPTNWRAKPSILNYVRFKSIDELKSELGSYDSKQTSDLLNKLSSQSLKFYISRAKADADLTHAKSNAKNNLSNTPAIDCVKNIVTTFNNVLNKDEYLLFPDELLECSENDRFLMGELKWMMKSASGAEFGKKALKGDVDAVVEEADRLRVKYRNPTSHIDNDHSIDIEFTQKFIKEMLGEFGENNIPVFKGAFMDKLCEVKRRACAVGVED